MVAEADEQISCGDQGEHGPVLAAHAPGDQHQKRQRKQDQVRPP